MATTNDIAFVVGVDDYQALPLPNCVADASEMARLLRRNGDQMDPAGCSSNFTVAERLVGVGDPPLSRHRFLKDLSELLARAKQCDFLFYFSGHGSNNDWGSELVISDNDAVGMQELLALIHGSEVRHAVLILDCCFSGAYGLAPGLGGQRDRFSTNVSLVRDNVTLLAACKADQVSFAGQTYSAFTELLIDGLRGGAADHRGVITAPALFGYAAPAFGPLDQRPMFKASISATEPLRTVCPSVDLAAVRRLHLHFPVGQDVLTLSGSEAPGAEVYDDLLVLREAGLVRCPDHRPLGEHVTETSVIELSAAGYRLRMLAARDKV